MSVVKIIFTLNFFLRLFKFSRSSFKGILFHNNTAANFSGILMKRGGIWLNIGCFKFVSLYHDRVFGRGNQDAPK